MHRVFPAPPWRILPTGTAFTSPVATLPPPASLARSKPCPIVTLSIFESFGAISTMLLPSRLTRVGSLMVFLAAAVIHPVGIGGQNISAGAPCSICLASAELAA